MYCSEMPILQYFLYFVAIFVLVVILQFFRNPIRNPIKNENHIICPADGKVVVIEEVEENEYLNKKCKQISVFMSPINVHVNRYPVSGEVTYIKYHPGKYLVAWHPKASTENERNTIAVKATNGVEVMFRQIAGAMARRIVFYSKVGDKAVQGEEFGFIKFGSRVDVFVPLDAKINVKIGEAVVGGETVLAEF